MPDFSKGSRIHYPNLAKHQDGSICHIHRDDQFKAMIRVRHMDGKEETVESATLGIVVDDTPGLKALSHDQRLEWWT